MVQDSKRKKNITRRGREGKESALTVAAQLGAFLFLFFLIFLFNFSFFLFPFIFLLFLFSTGFFPLKRDRLIVSRRNEDYNIRRIANKQYNRGEVQDTP